MRRRSSVAGAGVLSSGQKGNGNITMANAQTQLMKMENALPQRRSSLDFSGL